MAFLDAGGVRLIDDLRMPLKRTNQKSQDLLRQALGRIGGRQNASGAPRGEYFGQELQRAGNTASLGIEDDLLGALAGGSYEEAMQQKEHEASLALAQEIGDLSAPSTLEQVLAGLGGGARAGGQFSQLYRRFRKPSRGPAALTQSDVDWRNA